MAISEPEKKPFSTRKTSMIRKVMSSSIGVS